MTQQNRVSMVACNQITHQYQPLQDGSGRWWEWYLSSDGHILLSQQIPAGQPTQTSPAEVAAAAGVCTIAEAPVAAPQEASAIATPGSIGLPFPLLAIVTVGAVCAGLRAIQQRAPLGDSGHVFWGLCV